MPADTSRSPSAARIGLGWALGVAGAVLLWFRFSELPASITLYRAPWLEAPLTGPRTFLNVGRLVFMGLGQLGAGTAMAVATRNAPGWAGFWSSLVVVAGLKTSLECAELVAGREVAWARAFGLLNVACVGGFLVFALVSWRRGVLRGHPRVTGPALVVVVGSLVLWAGFAVAPRWFG